MRTRWPTTAVAPMTIPVPWSMKKLAPIRAPGWMSTPVFEWAISETRRASSGAQIMDQQAAYAGQSGGEIAHNRLGAGGERGFVGLAFAGEGEAEADLFDELGERLVQSGADEVIERFDRQFRPAVMGGKQRGGEAFDDGGDR